MQRSNFLLLAIIGLLFPLSGCNDDVFVDSLPAEDEMSATVEGDGGAVEFSIPTKDLLNISIDYYGSSSPYRYYDINGKEVDSGCPASDLSSIVYESNLIHSELIKQGNSLKFISYENASGYAIGVTVRLT